MSFNFSTIGNSFTIRVKLNELSGRDKVDLCRVLLDELGISTRMSSEPDETMRAQIIITEQWNLHWEDK